MPNDIKMGLKRRRREGMERSYEERNSAVGGLDEDLLWYRLVWLHKCHHLLHFHHHHHH
jgi:hypothetical protein